KTHQEPEGVQEAVDAENTGSPAGDNTASAETGAPSTTDEEITLPSPEEYAALMKELEEAQQKAAAFQDQYSRARAATDNVRRRPPTWRASAPGRRRSSSAFTPPHFHGGISAKTRHDAIRIANRSCGCRSGFAPRVRHGVLWGPVPDTRGISAKVRACSLTWW